MNKNEITKIIAKRTGIAKDAVQLVIDEYAEQIRLCLISGKNYYQRGFGSFLLIERKPKLARNIGKGTKMKLPACIRPKFKPCKDFIEDVKLFNHVETATKS